MMPIKANIAETRQGMIAVEKMLQQKARNNKANARREVLKPVFGHSSTTVDNPARNKDHRAAITTGIAANL